MKNKIAFVVIILIVALVCICGCPGTTTTQIPKHTVPPTPQISKHTVSPTTQISKHTVSPTTQISKHTVSPTKPVTTNPTKSPNSTLTTVPPPVKKTITPTYNNTKEQPGAQCSEFEPYVNPLNIRKNILTYGLNNCEMKKIFPKFANDKNYGILADPPKLNGISSAEWDKFIKSYKEGKNETSKTIPISSCVNPPAVSPQNPNWNFIEISARLEPGNAIPCNYEILFRFYGLGREIGQSRMNETLYKDQSVLIQTYIPIKTDEMDIFDYSTLEFE